MGTRPPDPKGKNLMLCKAVICMNLALIFYTWAVFGARRHGLSGRHLPLFGAGLLCDYLGTRLMLLFGLEHGVVPEWHIAVGLASLGGMALHFLLALAAQLVRQEDAVKVFFRRVSLYIYAGWLIAFVSGAVVGTVRG